MADTPLGSDAAHLGDYVNDYNKYKDNLQNIVTHYNQLRNVVQNKFEFLSRLQANIKILTFNLTSLQMTTPQSVKVYDEISSWTKPEDASKKGPDVTGWLAAEKYVVDSGLGIAEFGLIFYFTKWRKLKIEVDQANLRNFRRMTQTEVELADLSDVEDLEPGDFAAQLTERGQNIRVVVTQEARETMARQSFEANTQSVDTVRDLSAVDENTKIVLKDSSLLRDLGYGTIGTIALVGVWLANDTLLGYVEAKKYEGELKDQTRELEKTFARVAYGIEQLNVLHASVVSKINTAVTGIKYLITQLSNVVTPTFYFSQPNWVALWAWSAHINDGAVIGSSGVVTKTLTFNGDKIAWRYEPLTFSNNQWVPGAQTSLPNKRYTFDQLQPDWNYKLDQNAQNVLQMAEQASEQFAFISRAQYFQNNYVQNHHDVTLTAVAPGDENNNSNAPFKIFRDSSRALFGKVNGNYLTATLLRTVWNTALNDTINIVPTKTGI